MQLKLKIAGLVLVSSLIGFPTQLIAEPLKISPELPLEKQVELFTLVYGGDVEINKRVIKGESNWDQTTSSDGNRSNGIAQFQEPTFNRLSKLMGEELDYHSSYDQIKLMVWSIANGHGSNWTVYRCIKNGGEYSFYSKQLKKYFTVRC